MAITAGPLLNSVAAPQKQTLATNYLDFTSGNNDWAQQYLPDLMEREAEVFGNRTVSGFLNQVGAEESMTSDQVIWSEQGRLHLSYKGYVSAQTAANTANTPPGGTITIESDIDGNNASSSPAFSPSNHGIRVHDMLLVSDASATTQCLVTEVNNAVIDVVLYDATAGTGTLADAGLATGSTGDGTVILVYGSEYGKGVTGRKGANEPTFKSFSNKPIILKDKYEISGSDTARIGWVEISGEVGQNGYLWYLKSEADTRARFTDHLEMAMVESVKGDYSQSGLETIAASNTTTGFNMLGDGSSTTNAFGTEGLFAAVSSRGNVTTGVTGVNAATDLAEFDAMLAEFDGQGAIEENMLFVNRATALAMDDMLASMNSYGAGGTSYGVFNNSEDMALNLGFSGFRRGSYDFYKSDWKYLNDKSTRGGINAKDTVNAVRGMVVPAGVSSVYDQMLGRNLKRPFLHVRYRASQTDDRRFKTWVTGSVGAVTSDLDAMEIHMLSERCLIVQGANNFMIMK